MPGQIAYFVAALVGVYLAYITFRRLLGERDDPTGSVVAQSKTGGFTFLVSGTWYVAALGLVILGLTWPVPEENPSLVVVVLFAVGLHWFLERRERS